MTPVIFQARVCLVRGCRRPEAKVMRTRGGIKLLACKHTVLDMIEVSNNDNNGYMMDFRRHGGIRL